MSEFHSLQLEREIQGQFRAKKNFETSAQISPLEQAFFRQLGVSTALCTCNIPISVKPRADKKIELVTLL
jgi:hypothetical protein